MSLRHVHQESRLQEQSARNFGHGHGRLAVRTAADVAR